MFFIHKSGNVALILSARDMDNRREDAMNENDDAQLTPISGARTPKRSVSSWTAIVWLIIAKKLMKSNLK